MKLLSRLPCQHSGTVSIIWAKSSKRKVQSIWRRTAQDSYHLIRLYIGRLVILRIRQTPDHARRLGLPIV
jgi:hypothetical protein